MASPHQLPKLFNLETLDVRFTNSSKAPLPDPTKPSVRPKPGNVAADACPPLWRTPEFYFYYLAFLVCVPLMFNAVYQVSKRSLTDRMGIQTDVQAASHPNYSKFEHLLSPGWIPGRKVDNSDIQYSFFRDHIPYLMALLAIHPLLRRAFDTFTSESRTDSNVLQSQNADDRMDRRLRFDFGFAIFLLFVLHGFSAFKILLILYINFSIAKKLPRNYVVPVTWVSCLGCLFANELLAGYPYQRIAAFLSPSSADSQKQNWGSWLDERGGLISRWEVLFNITVLRLISFNLDYVWSLNRSASNSLEKKQLDPSNLSERDRIDIPPARKDFSFRNYLAYALYSPLYLAGPILTFNDFIAQCRYPSVSISAGRIVRYGIRFFVCLLVMELMLHYIYAVAISKAEPAWEAYTPFEVSMLGYFNLHHIWFKLLLPWRFFRFWALLDGIDAPENMVRCASNNYSALAFWRGWHRSFNRWILRYIYIPLGGSNPRGLSGFAATARTIINYLAVFSFVAVWHDINLRLLMWGWLVVIFFLPEMMGMLAFPQRKWKDYKTTYRVICGIGAIFNILMMMVANLVGFALGVDGIMGLIHGIINSWLGILYLLAACSALFVGVQVMFETREEERRHGIKMNC